MAATSSTDGLQSAVIGRYLLLLSVTVPAAAAALVVAIVAVIGPIVVAFLLE